MATPDRPPPNRPGGTETQRLFRLAAMGGTLAAQILVAGLAGWFLDRWLNTGPWLLVALLILGVTVSMTQFIREALRETSAGRSQPAPPRRPKGPES